MTAENFWGTIPKSADVRLPLTILREQADLLGELTDNFLEGRIYVSTITKSKVSDSSENLAEIIYAPPNESNRHTVKNFAANLDIVAPTLNQYRLTILVMSYSIIEIYPVTLENVLTQQKITCADEAAFTTSLETILTSSEVRQVISSLLTQVQVLG